MNRSRRLRAFCAGFTCAIVAALAVACGSGSPGSSTATPASGNGTTQPTVVVSPGGLTPTGTAAPAVTTTPAASLTPSPAIDEADLAHLKQMATLPATGEPFHAAVWRSDGQGVFVASGDKVSFLDLTGQSKALATLSYTDTLLDISAAGLLAVTADRHTITVRPVSSSAGAMQIHTDATVTAAHFAPDASFLAATIAERIAVQLFDLRSGQMIREITGFETAAPVYAVKIGPDGRKLIWYARATAQVMDLVANTFAAPVQTEDFMSDLELKPDRTELATSSGETLTFWDLEAGEAIDTLRLGQLVLALSYTPGGDILAIGLQDGVRFYAHNKLLADTLMVDQAIDVSFSPVGNALATVSGDFNVALWSPQP